MSLSFIIIDFYGSVLNLVVFFKSGTLSGVIGLKFNQFKGVFEMRGRLALLAYESKSLY